MNLSAPSSPLYGSRDSYQTPTPSITISPPPSSPFLDHGTHFEKPLRSYISSRSWLCWRRGGSVRLLLQNKSLDAHVPHSALRILPQITRRIHRIDVSQNLLGAEGAAVLVSGLATIRHRFSVNELWGISEINLGGNGLNDEGLVSVISYAKKDVCLNKVMLQGNEIKVRGRTLVLDLPQVARRASHSHPQFVTHHHPFPDQQRFPFLSLHRNALQPARRPESTLASPLSMWSRLQGG